MAPLLPPPPMPAMMAGDLPHEMDEAMRKESEKSKSVLANISRAHMAKLKEEEEISKSIMDCEKRLSMFYQKQGRANKNEAARDEWLRKEIHDLERELLSKIKQKSLFQAENQKLKDAINRLTNYIESRKSESTKLESALANKQKDHNDFMRQENALQDERTSFWKEENSAKAVINVINGGIVKTRKSLDHAASVDPSENHQSDTDLNNQSCLDKKTTIKALKILSLAALTMIGTLSTYSASLAPALARFSLTQEVFLISPYVCIIVALIGVALSFCASESNGLAEYASIAILLVCLSGIGLGALGSIIIEDPALRGTVHIWTLHWTLLIITVTCGWGCLFAYPTCLRLNMRMVFWICFDRRRSTYPWCAVYADPGSAEHTDQKGFGRMLSCSLAAFQNAVHPLDKKRTIDFMKAFSPAVLTGISTLSLWAAHTVAPQAYFAHKTQRFLYTLPYMYLPLGVIAIALCASASKSNGLASYGSGLVLVLCVCGVKLGGCCIIVLLRSGPLSTSLVEIVLVFTLICAWGWMLAYPKMLSCLMRLTICACCARRLKIYPRRYEGCGCTSMGWMFGSLEVCSGLFRIARGWWTAGRAALGGDLDLEAGAAALELTPLAVSPSPEEAEQGAERITT